MKKLKEPAKFFAGVAAWESVVHASLLVSGANPVVFGITLSNEINLLQTIVPAIVSILLGYFAWRKK